MTGAKPVAFVVIATSGSTDYLRDTTVGQRFWPVTIPARASMTAPSTVDVEGLHGTEDEAGGAKHHEVK